MNESSSSTIDCRSSLLTHRSRLLTRAPRSPVVLLLPALTTFFISLMVQVSLALDNNITSESNDTMTNETSSTTTAAGGGGRGQQVRTKYLGDMNTLAIVVLVAVFIAFLCTSCCIYEHGVGYFFYKWKHYDRPKHNVLRVDTMRLIFVDDDVDYPGTDKQTTILKTDSGGSIGQKSSEDGESGNPAPTVPIKSAPNKVSNVMDTAVGSSHDPKQ